MIQEAYLVCLIGLTLLGFVCRDGAKTGTPLVLLANWSACTTVGLLTGDPYPVLFLAVADYGSAWGVLILRRSHWQSAIIAIYAVQIVCHAAYTVSGMGIGPTYYSYWALTYLGWLQIALIGGWHIHDLVRSRASLFSGGPAASRDDALAREKTR